jgi:pepF/M3 family oligoendopeptidase
MSTETTVGTMPHWDMTVVYPSLDSPEFEKGFHSVIKRVADLETLFDAEAIAAPLSPTTLDSALFARFEKVTRELNAIYEEVKTLRAYIASFVSTDSRNALAQAKMSELRRPMVTLNNLDTRFTAWIGGLDVEALIAASPLAGDHAYYLRQAKIMAARLMSPAEEELASELALSGGSAWSRLYSDLTSQISVPFARRDGDTPEDLPISVIRALATDPDPEIRRRAYEAELGAWERNALPIAAALNAIKQETNALATRRRWESPLDSACFNNHIDRETLEAMLSAARKSFPDFRRYLRAKARLVSGTERLAFYDLFAPVGASSRAWQWDEAERFVAEQFGAYSAKMQDFAERAFREKWIDAEPRPGKRDGAFCMGLRRDESRIMQNYRPAFGGVSTLAHELGHGYHNLCLAHRTPLQRNTPMTLAETASIFCETIIKRAALATGTDEERIAILEASLQGTCQVVVDITSRFLFERRVLEARQQRELSAGEFCDLMREAQLETYGDGLDENYLHPYMWAAKGHYYGSTFYNFPYMFGLLFGLGLYAQYQEKPDGFHDRYDDLLSATGMYDAATLASRFGFDLREESFWNASFDILRDDIRQFEELSAA